MNNIFRQSQRNDNNNIDIDLSGVSDMYAMPCDGDVHDMNVPQMI